MMHASDMREDYEPFERAGSFWYWQPDNTYAGPFRTMRAATLSAQRQFAQMYPVSTFNVQA